MRGLSASFERCRGFLLRGLAVEHGCLRNFQHFEDFPPPVRLFSLWGGTGCGRDAV